MKGRQSHFHTAAYQHGEIYISSLYYAFVLNCLLLKRLSFHTLLIWLKAVREDHLQARYILCLMSFLPLRQSLLLLKYMLTIKSLLLQLQCNIFDLILQQVNYLSSSKTNAETKNGRFSLQKTALKYFFYPSQCYTSRRGGFDRCKCR